MIVNLLRAWRVCAGAALLVCLLGSQALSAPAVGVTAMDLREATTAGAWKPAHDISALTPGPEGLAIAISGGDPYMVGPASDYPEGQPLWVTVRVRSEQGGDLQLFYYGEGSGPGEERAVHMAVPPGVWANVRAPLPPLGPSTHFRIDPPGDHGVCVIQSVTVEPRVLFAAPSWPKPLPFSVKPSDLTLRSGDLSLRHASDRLGAWSASVAAKPMASGNSRAMLGYLIGEQIRWLDLTGARARVTANKTNLIVTATAVDADGGKWSFRQIFSAGPRPGVISVLSSVAVNVERRVVFVPLFTLLPGLGTFGEQKGHALFGGYEYLDRNEPSSSEADIIGPGHFRLVPDTLGITVPLMVVQADDRYIGLTWNPADQVAALFDSPDRQLRSGAHLLALIAPGAGAQTRAAGSLLPYDPLVMTPNQPLQVGAALVGGRGASVLPAIQVATALNRLPPLPTLMARDDYVKAATTAWLSSKVRDGVSYRHAYSPGGGWSAQPIADGPLFMEWLAEFTRDPDEAHKLRLHASAVLKAVSRADVGSAGVGHVRSVAPALLFGPIIEEADRADRAARALLSRFEPNGSIRYEKPASGNDLGRTHFARDANGLTAQVVSVLLEDAALSGDPGLIKSAIARLHGLDRFANSAPRGAQTWEVPLHTPDILASAYLTKAYTLGFEITHDFKLLNQASAWAWSGVPFVYLRNPTNGPVGPYATIAVYGATQWVAPNWMGLPVQWCGLVYADALYRLALFVPTGPWRRIADGITVSGIQQSYPVSDPDLAGLLPDSFNLRAQTRNYPAINPASLAPEAARLYGGLPFYSMRGFPTVGVVVHVPGLIDEVREKGGVATFDIRPWMSGRLTLMLSGLQKGTRVAVNGETLDLSKEPTYDPKTGRAALPFHGRLEFEISSATAVKAAPKAQRTKTEQEREREHEREREREREREHDRK